MFVTDAMESQCAIAWTFDGMFAKQAALCCRGLGSHSNNAEIEPSTSQYATIISHQWRGFRSPLQAKELGVPLEEPVLEHMWSKLVSSHFSTLEREIKEMVTEKTGTGDNIVREDLLKELGWAISKKDFDNRVEGETHPGRPFL